eukprot:7941385-Alexandrium_andersonii.AAC.1
MELDGPAVELEDVHEERPRHRVELAEPAVELGDGHEERPHHRVEPHGPDDLEEPAEMGASL